MVTDPHEISNVAGTAGLDFMLETTKDLALSVSYMLPSCVPATGLDESGAVLGAEQLRPYYQQPRVLGLAELMNSYTTSACQRCSRQSWPSTSARRFSSSTMRICILRPSSSVIIPYSTKLKIL